MWERRERERDRNRDRVGERRRERQRQREWGREGERGREIETETDRQTDREGSGREKHYSQSEKVFTQRIYVTGLCRNLKLDNDGNYRCRT